MFNLFGLIEKPSSALNLYPIPSQRITHTLFVISGYVLPMHKNYKRKNANFAGYLEAEFNYLTAKEYYRRDCAFYTNGVNNYCRKQIDSWTKINMVQLDFPWPLTNRYHYTINFEIYLDEKHLINFTIAPSFLPYELRTLIPLEQAKKETGFKENKNYIQGFLTKAMYLIDNPDKRKLSLIVYAEMDLGIKIFGNQIVKWGFTKNFAGYVKSAALHE